MKHSYRKNNVRVMGSFCAFCANIARNLATSVYRTLNFLLLNTLRLCPPLPFNDFAPCYYKIKLVLTINKFSAWKKWYSTNIS
jgi:hypothetical protein